MGAGSDTGKRRGFGEFLNPNGFFGSQQRIPSSYRVKAPVVGSGLLNLGNTCYLNSIVQSLIHTAPLYEILSSADTLCDCGDDDRGDDTGKFCSICSLRKLADQCLNSREEAVHPCCITDNLKSISPSFVNFRQEDAHEFFCFLLENLSRSCKVSNNAAVKEDCFINQIFGGCLRSRVRCCECGHCSDTFEPSPILSLEIDGIRCLEDALKSFTSIEKIDDPETRIECNGCDSRVPVEKQLSLNQPSQVVVLHLKRFDMHGLSDLKLETHVSFPLELDLGPFLSTVQGGVEFLYDLYAIVVHYGQTLHSGHYYSYIRTAPDIWHEMDDEKVTKVDAEHVKNQQAYILFYIKKGSAPWFSSILERKMAESSPSSVLDGPQAFHSLSPDQEIQSDTDFKTKQEEVNDVHTYEEMKADSSVVGMEDLVSPPERDTCYSVSGRVVACEASCSGSPASPPRSPSPKETTLHPYGDEQQGDGREDDGVVLKRNEEVKPACMLLERGRMSEILNRQMRGMPRNKRVMLLSCMPRSQSAEISQNHSRKRKAV